MIYVYLSTCKWSAASILIRYGTRCPWSHAGFYDSINDTYLSAQVKGGVKVRPANEECFDSRLLCIVPRAEEAYQWALTQVGKPYDWKAILGIASGSGDWHDGNDYFCSELVAAGFEAILQPLLNPDNVVWRITPRDLLLSPLVHQFNTKIK